jgi:hypothetical protein
VLPELFQLIQDLGMTQDRVAAPLDYVTAEGRICPMLGPWVKLHRMLGRGAPNPAILAAWYEPALWKVAALRAQILYAAEHGKLAEADRFLRSLRPSYWLYFERDGRDAPLPASVR